MKRQLRLRRLLRYLLALGLAAAAGCTQQPGALRLTVVPERESFSHAEPSVLRVQLQAVKGNVAIYRDHYFAVDYSRNGAPFVIDKKRRFVCGTPFFSNPAWSLFLVAVHLLDIGNVGGKLILLTEGQELSERLLVPPDNSFPEAYLKTAEDQTPWEFARTGEGESFEPGRYHLRVSFINEGIVFPAPLFWKGYEPPVSSETDLVVQE